MFVARRDLRFASGRFALVAGVVVLITMLVTFLSALTQGLARESTSAIADLPADHVAFAAGEEDPSFTVSQVGPAQWEALAARGGVEHAEPLGVATTRAGAGDTTATVTALGAEPGATLLPGDVDLAAGQVWLSPAAAEDLGAGAGDTLALAGTELEVAGVSGTAASYSHSPVVWTTLSDWQPIGATTGPGATGEVATVVALTTDGEADLAAADAAAGTVTVDRSGSLQAIGSYASENGSLMMMQGFLYAISALVVGAFFTVWTISRFDDVAVLKALGASNGYLLRDALGQAAVVLVVGTALGTAIASAGALALSSKMPIALGWTTTAVPALLLVVLGLLGAAVALRRITSVDPHAALSAG